MFLCDEPGQPGQIDLSVKWLKRGRGRWGTEGEVELERQVIVSLGVEVDLSVIWQNRKGKNKEQKSFLFPFKILSDLSRRRGNRKGEYWPQVVWFVLLGEWNSNSVLIRHTALLETLAFYYTKDNPKFLQKELFFISSLFCFPCMKMQFSMKFKKL